MYYTYGNRRERQICGQVDRAPHKIYSRHSSFHPCEGPDQRRIFIVCRNFKEEKILSCKKISETFIHGKRTCSAIRRCGVF